MLPHMIYQNYWELTKRRVQGYSLASTAQSIAQHTSIYYNVQGKYFKSWPDFNRCGQ